MSDGLEAHLEYYTTSWQDDAFTFTSENSNSIIKVRPDLDDSISDTTTNYQFGFNATGWFRLDWSIMSDTYFYEDDEDVYAESFADVSDWSLEGTEAGETLSSDGDICSLEIADDYDIMKSTGLSLDASASYIEWLGKVNTTTNYDYSTIYLEDGDGDQRYYSFTLTTSWLAWKISVAECGESGTCDESDIVQIKFMHRLSSGGQITVQHDYLRVANSTSMGWQHDGSTTAGIDTAGTTTVSDGDLLNVSNCEGSHLDFQPDSTSTTSYIDTEYYPFLEWKISSLNNADGDGRVWYSRIHCADDSYPITQDWTTETGIFRVNMKSSTTEVKEILFYGDGSDWFTIDYIKAYSIAHFSSFSSMSVDDYLYVDSGILYWERSGTSTLYAYYESDLLSVSASNYQVWNCSVSSDSSNFGFGYYASSWTDADMGETRGDTSGTITRFRLRSSGDFSLSAITFIEDSTAPSVVRSNFAPVNPEDDEAITLSTVVTDTVEVYSVDFNAITSPSGFTDTDYAATEGEENLWTYEFASGDLPNGYYCFKIVASDGANTNTLGEHSYVDFTVREAEITVQEITLIGAGEDFEMMTFSARINRDCSYTIYEESASSPEAATYTGSVSAPSFNLAWEKLDVDDSNVNFTITFVNGSLTYNYTSQYQVAQTTFYVEDHRIGNTESICTVSGRITKTASYTVLDDDSTVRDTGTVTSLDFKIRFDMWEKATNEWVNFTIRFTNGSQTCYIYGEYFALKLSDYKGNPGAPDSPAQAADRKNILFASGVAAIFSIATVGYLIYDRVMK
jgi:hypothetical protein